MWQLVFQLLTDTTGSSSREEAITTNIGVILGPIVAIVLVICAAVFVIFALRYLVYRFFYGSYEILQRQPLEGWLTDNCLVQLCCFNSTRDFYRKPYDNKHSKPHFQYDNEKMSLSCCLILFYIFTFLHLLYIFTFVQIVRGE